MNRILIALILTALAAALWAVPRDMVVVEIGTGTWCPYCPGAAMGADDLVENGHRAAIIENHNSDSYANTYSNARNSYYGIGNWPTAYFDGMNPTEGGSNTNSMYSGYRTKVNNRLAVPSNYTISAAATHEGLVYTVTVTVTRMEPDSQTNLRLHGALTQSGIQQSWQGQTHLEFVNRLMAPGASGTPIDFSTGETQTLTLTFNASAAWNAEHFEWVFFLQNNSTKEILQGCKYVIQALENTNPLSVQSIDFGTVPQDGIYTESFTLNNWWTQDMNIELSVDSQDYFVYPQFRDAYLIPFHGALTFDVGLVPSHAGPDNATITITTDNPHYPLLTIPLTANITGTANAQETAAQPAEGIRTAFPNPFRNATTISYQLHKAAPAELEIYNLKGEKVYSGFAHDAKAGLNNFSWDGKDSQANACPAGIYFIRLNAGGQAVSTHKLVKLQ